MTGAERRNDMLQRIQESEKPMSGTKLAGYYEVSRQVIVQDIALLRAAGYDIISTNKGYILQNKTTISKIFKVYHTDEQLEDELLTIVDLGGCVDDVRVNHKVYGQLQANLNIKSRRHIKEFMDDIASGKSHPLKNVTSGYHYHKISAESEEVLSLIEQTLREKGYLLSE